MVLTEQLRGFRILSELSERELEQLARISKLETRPKGDRIAAEKALASALYLLIEGQVDIRMSGPGGQPVTIDTIGPGQTFGWSAVADSHTFTAAVWVVEDARLIALNGDALRNLFEENNHIGYRVMKEIIAVVSRRVHALHAKLAANSARH